MVAIPLEVWRLAGPLIMTHEGFQAHPYDDGLGNMAIGYGSSPSEFPDGRLPESITEPQAAHLLYRRCCEVYYPAVRDLMVDHGCQLTINAQAGYLDASYNLGPAILAPPHTLGILLYEHRYREAADSLLQYSDPGTVDHAGLLARRETERALVLRPDSLDETYQLHRFLVGYHVEHDGHRVAIYERGLVRDYHLLYHTRLHHAREWQHLVGQLVLARRHIWAEAHHGLKHGQRPDWSLHDRGWRCAQIGALVPPHSL